MRVPPLVVLVAESFPPGDASVQPIALQSYNNTSLLDHWWHSLSAHSLFNPARVYIVTNAIYYKAIEFWSIGRGLDVSHVVNTGCSLGDARVDLQAALHAIRLARSRSPAELADAPVMVIAADSVATHPGANGGMLKALSNSVNSCVLLQPTPSDAKEYPLFRPSGGPEIVAVFSATAGADACTVYNVCSSAAALEGSLSPSSSTAHIPLVFKLSAADATSLLEPDALRVISADFSATRNSGGDSGDDSEPSHAPAIVTIDAALTHLARNGTLSGIRIDAAFHVGAADGRRPHSVPVAVTSTSLIDAAAASTPATVASLPASAGLSQHLHRFVNTLYGHAEPIHARAHARVGVLGNPSDGYGGKTASLTIGNFAAEAWLHPNSDGSVTLIPHPVFDPMRFASPAHLSVSATREGYSGGIRLMEAAVHRFYGHCKGRGVALPPSKGFSLRYHTTIPRQVGLAGSSAIITALLRVIMRYYGYGTEEAAARIGLSRRDLPNFVLSIESEELGITAGLQDRVVQVYEGFVHMDFLPFFAKTQPYGNYTKLPVAGLPPLFLAYAADPSDSGRIHAPVKQRWLAGDVEVVEGMKRIAALADEGLKLITERPYSAASTTEEKEAIASEWARAFTTNFNTRRQLWGDAALGADNVRMVEIARACGASAKFPGSGGAVVGVVDVAGIDAAGKLLLSLKGAPASTEARVAAAMAALRTAYLAEGFVFTPIVPFET